MNVISGTFLYGIAIGIIASILLCKAKCRVGPSAQSLGLLIAGALALGLTWYVLFLFLVLTTGRVLAPWDQWAGFAPMSGTWQRQLNDFFGQEHHQYIVASVVVGVSGMLLLLGMLRALDWAVRARLLLVFVLTTAAFLVVSLLALHLVSWLGAPRSAADIGYHRSWPDLFVTLVLLGLLFWVQGRMALLPFWRQKRTSG